MHSSVLYALLAAALFGASTPFAKLLVGELSPVLLGGLLYLGSGIGLTLARLVRDRGFGFIRDDGGQEWFFHRTAVEAGSFDELNEGQRVSFEEEPSQKGPRAANIRMEG